MRKKIESELKALANEILQLSETSDLVLLHKKSAELYEKLSLLKFVDNYFETRFDDIEIPFSPVKIEQELEESSEVKEGIFDDEELVYENDDFFEDETEEQELEKIEETDTFLNYPNKQLSLEEELEIAISVDYATDLFEKSERVEPKTVSLNDKLQNSSILVGLNDRIAFVKYLFNGSQEDYNRVLSQLNSFESESESKDFLLNIVKPDYDWSNKQEYEQRLLFLIERKFL